MHIHPNNNLQLASLGFAREEAQIQAKRAAEVRRKLSAAASRIAEDSEELASPGLRVERRSYDSEPRPGDDETFGRLFSAKA
jgi:hypothetical protein